MSQEYTIKIVADTASAQSNIKGVAEDIKKANKETVNAGKAQADLSTSTNALDKATGGMVSKLRGSIGVLKGVTAGFRTMRGAIISTGIGALVVAIGSLTAAFTASEEGQNKFNKILGAIGVVTGNLVDLLADLGEKIISVFENPLQAWENFKTAVLENLKNRFEGLLELIPNLGNAISLLFKGEFAEAGKVAADAAAKVTLGVENFTDKIGNAIEKTKEFIKEQQEELKIADDIANKRAEADKAERALIVARAEANRKIAELRERAADKENVSVEERIAALKEAGRINEEIAQQEIEAARLRFEAKQAENALSKSTKADLDEEARLRAVLIDLQTNQLKTQKALTAEITTALREEEAERNRIEAERKAAEKEKEKEKEDADKKEKERLEKLKVEEIKKEEAVAKVTEDLEARKLQAKKQAVDGAISLFGAESKAGKAFLITKQIMNAQEAIEEAKKTLTFSTLVAARSQAALAEGTAQTAKIGFPQNIPMLIGYALQAVGIISAISSAVGKSKQAASNAGAGGSVGVSFSAPSIQTSTPPQVNTVGASGVNQLAQTINQQNKQPIKAYVVAGEVSSAQSLERNAVKEASI